MIEASLNDSQYFMTKAFGVLQLTEETQSGQKVKVETICSHVFGPMTSLKMRHLVQFNFGTYIALVMKRALKRTLRQEGDICP